MYGCGLDARFVHLSHMSDPSHPACMFCRLLVIQLVCLLKWGLSRLSSQASLFDVILAAPFVALFTIREALCASGVPQGCLTMTQLPAA